MTKSSPQHIVWDWNGTLLDDNHAVVSAVNEVCTAFDREHIDIDEWRSLYERPLSKCYEQLLRRELDDQDWARIDVLYHDNYRGLLDTCGMAEGVPHALDDWAAAGGSQSLLSMWFHDELVDLVTARGLHERFARMDGLRSSIGGGSKAAHLREHLRAQQLDPAEVVLIGDVLDDAHAADEAGARCVLVTTGVMDRAKLETAGHPVVDSIPQALALLTP
ncbi:HAD family hydrolase [Saccharopolyspora flava]|uniref:Phosphoglycolate phosphatase, HAD superfamily n=1 Tax=Saccharopolyspora flava TaxID=95161 RepID=A0A1I6RS83_9PSEU|nr:HAD family hydrolase [Saccharopolyspora flava]SFS67544.1 Phosphoglycolate phosphatase, HAD superfamily [Saccharopolyspora flava]